MREPQGKTRRLKKRRIHSSATNGMLRAAGALGIREWLPPLFFGAAAS
jgi:hypothetical protein